MATWTDNPEPPILTPLIGAPEKLSWMAKIARWLGGASRSEVVDATHVTQSVAPRDAQTMVRADTTVGNAVENTDPVDQPTDGKKDDVKPEKGAPLEQVDAVIQTPLPLIYVETQTGGKYYIRRDDWLGACAERATNVPTCDWHGGPVPPGENISLRRTTVEKSKQTPVPIPTVDAYAMPPEHTQERGPSISG